MKGSPHLMQSVRTAGPVRRIQTRNKTGTAGRDSTTKSDRGGPLSGLAKGAGSQRFLRFGSPTNTGDTLMEGDPGDNIRYEIDSYRS